MVMLSRVGKFKGEDSSQRIMADDTVLEVGEEEMMMFRRFSRTRIFYSVTHGLVVSLYCVLFLSKHVLLVI